MSNFSQNIDELRWIEKQVQTIESVCECYIGNVGRQYKEPTNIDKH